MCCSYAEAEPVALSCTACGFHAFILRYSAGNNAAGFAPLKQMDWVVRLLRKNADQWHRLSIEWIYKAFGRPQFEDKETIRMTTILKDIGLGVKGF